MAASHSGWCVRRATPFPPVCHLNCHPLIPVRDWYLGERRSKNEYPPHTFQAGTLWGRAAYPWSSRHTGDPPNPDLYALKCTGTTGVYGWRFRWQPRGKRVAASKIRVVQAAYPHRKKSRRKRFLQIREIPLFEVYPLSMQICIVKRR